MRAGTWTRGIALACWSLAAGCGMAPQPEFTGARSPTGVAPYRGQGALEICIGPHRVGPPGSELGGFCVPKGTSQNLAPCSTDSDCPGREHCVCGRCMVKYCTRNDECGPDEMCDFSANRCVKRCTTECDCPGPNARCDLGMCQQMCLVDAECQTGEVCSLSRGRCLTVPCHSDEDCFEDEECLIEREPRHVAAPSVLAEGPGRFRFFFDMDVYGQKMIFSGMGDEHQVSVQPRSVLEPPACVQGTTCYDYTEPTVFRYRDRYVMFFVRTPFLYDSSREPECGNGVCELGENRITGCPGDCPSDGIFRAESTDGTNWRISPESAVLVAHYDWEEGDLRAPWALVSADGARLFVYYESGHRHAIGRAETEDLSGSSFPDPAVDQPDAVQGVRKLVLTPREVEAPPLWRGIDQVGMPYVSVDEDALGRTFYRMWFAARGFESGTASSFGSEPEQIPANTSIGYAGSPDGLAWEVWPYNPVFDRIEPNTFVNHASEFYPRVVGTGDRFLLFFCGSDRDETSWENVGVAVNPPLTE